MLAVNIQQKVNKNCYEWVSMPVLSPIYGTYAV